MWTNVTKITRLWAGHDDRDAWFYADGLGWRKLPNTSDTVFLQQLAVVCQAYGNNRDVSFDEVDQGGNIEILAVFAF
jgi:hypothetical protein